MMRHTVNVVELVIRLINPTCWQFIFYDNTQFIIWLNAILINVHLSLLKLRWTTWM